MDGIGGGGNDAELFSKTLQLEHKLFFFDLKENPRGPFLKISEKTSVARSTIIVPVKGIAWFLDFFNCYADENDESSKELKLAPKVYYFDVGENPRGKFLKVSEVSAGRNRSTILIPAGSSGEGGWAIFRNILQEISDEAERLFILPKQPRDHAERLAGLSDDGEAEFIISGHNGKSVPGSDHNVDLLEEMSNMDSSKLMRVDQKRFFFDLGSNNRGHFLKISEVTGADRSSIILPLSALKQFHDMIGHFVEVTREDLEGMTAANVRTLKSLQR